MRLVRLGVKCNVIFLYYIIAKCCENLYSVQVWKRGIRRRMREKRIKASPRSNRIELPWRARKAVSLFPRLATRIESWKASSTDRISFRFPSWDTRRRFRDFLPLFLGGMRTAFLSAPVIVRDLYDTVPVQFQVFETLGLVSRLPANNLRGTGGVSFFPPPQLSSGLAFYRPVSCSIRRDAWIPLKTPLLHTHTHTALYASFSSQICIKLCFQLLIVRFACWFRNFIGLRIFVMETMLIKHHDNKS